MTVKELLERLQESQQDEELYIWAEALDGSPTRYDILAVDPNPSKSRVEIAIKERE